ncbi:MAG TPA: DnaA N-terminal domain-containing protein, partial [Thermoanaerobaculia bacterium]
MSDPSLWSLLQRQLQQQLDPEDFSTWFRPLKVQSEREDRLVLLAPNPRFLHTLEESFRPQVDRAVAGLSGPSFEVLFSLEEKAAEAPGPSQFNPKYLFSNFVVGSSNQFAHAAARAVAESP